MSDRCLGMLECDRLKLGGCERSLFGDIGVRSFIIMGLCAIAVWGCGMRLFKIGGL
ncbi:hypothetical protein IQ226_04440 [Dolichospermum sp. LEGE 00240]|uniref:hypothetical protein n=1 Tax=Dolichospermum sp. LEGE 00240 TaxID=1828603 RepID=UPI00188022E2|nr:hypothetical protein [Dolichospermum sp. LEGE 00240]MBE9248452.1 hypothetical protein [Dolichospermum sp. LEGE 00240]MDM3851927.1 hypothetical protein [Aphanizomenon gracile PMC627.10]